MFIRVNVVAILMMCAALASSACGSTSPSGSSSFSWSVDGRSYQAAADGLTYSNDSKNTFAGFTCSNGQSATLSTPSVGTKFQTGSYNAPFTPSGTPAATGAFQLVINEGLPAASGGLVPSWVASAGTLTLTTVDGSHIVGSFDVTLVPNGNSSEIGTAHGTGTFDVPPFTGVGNLCAAEASGS